MQPFCPWPGHGYRNFNYAMAMMRLSAKQKREVYSLSSLLLHLIVFVILLITLNSCTEEEVTAINFNVPATVETTTDVEGCGFVLVLANGQRLQPIPTHLNWDNTSATTKLNASKNQTFTNGQKVIIAYKESAHSSISLVNQAVEITSIRYFHASESANFHLYSSI